MNKIIINVKNFINKKKILILKKHKTIGRILLQLVLISGVLALVLGGYKAYDKLQAQCQPGDILAFYGAMLSFVSSATISVIALFQTYKLNKKSNEKEDVNFNRPYLSIEKVVYDGKELEFVDNSWKWITNKLDNVEIILKNYGNGIAKDLYYVSGFSARRDLYRDRRADVPVDKSHKMKVRITEKYVKKIQFSYKNILNYEYNYYIPIMVYPTYDEDGGLINYTVSIFNVYER